MRERAMGACHHCVGLLSRTESASADGLMPLTIHYWLGKIVVTHHAHVSFSLT